MTILVVLVLLVLGGLFARGLSLPAPPVEPISGHWRCERCSAIGTHGHANYERHLAIAHPQPKE